jgi:AcrR family transcriptional regulator
LRVNLEARALNAERRRNQTRERLIQAALAVIAQKGPDAPSVEDFVAAAGVSRGTFYNYFPATEDLLAALNERLMSDLANSMRAVTSDVTDPAMMFAVMVHQTLEQVTRDPVRAWVVLQIVGGSTPRSESMSVWFDALMAEGEAIGRFAQVERAAARHIAFGATRLAATEMLTQRAGLDQAEPVVSMMLAAFGLARDEAVEVSREARRRVAVATDPDALVDA